jgi:hypothetical protein
MAQAAVPEASRRRLEDTVARLGALLPDEWRLAITKREPMGGLVTVVDDDGQETSVYVIALDRLEPRDIDKLRLPRDTLVSAAWLSPRARELLRESQTSFLDRTGNAEIRLRRPTLYVRTDGASRDPKPKPTKGPTLRGPRVWSLLRTLVEVAPPYTAGDLSAALDLDDGYVSRVLQALVDERLITRRPRGPVIDVAWESLLRQLATRYSLFEANETSTWVASSGPQRLLLDLSNIRAGRWVVTGSFAASSIVSVAAPEVAVIFSDDPERLAKAGRLLPATTGANVIVASPYDAIVFERGWTNADYPCASVAQTALDCLTGSARMPAEGNAVVEWMARNPVRWREPNLGG